MPMLMTPHYWQLFASQQTDLLLLPLLINRGLARIQEWRNHWCTILNPNKTKALVVSRSRTVNPSHGDLVLSGIFICAIVPTLTYLAWSLTQAHLRDHMRGIVSSVSRRIDILRSVKRVFVNTSLLLRCYYICIWSPNPWVLFSGVGVCFWISSLASRASGAFGGQALPLSEFLVIVLSTSCCTRLNRTRIIVCPVRFHLLLSEFNIPELRLLLIH